MQDPSPGASTERNPSIIAFPGGPGCYVLVGPTDSQLTEFQNDVSNDSGRRRIDSGVLARLGAVWYPQMTDSSEAAAFITPTQSSTGTSYGWPKDGGVWVLDRPSEEQWERFNRPLQDRGNNEEYCERMKEVGAVFYADPRESDIVRPLIGDSHPKVADATGEEGRTSV